MRRRLHDLPVLRLWPRSALPRDGGLQPQAESVAAGLAAEEEVQTLGAEMAKAEVVFFKDNHDLLVFLSLPAEFN